MTQLFTTHAHFQVQIFEQTPLENDIGSAVFTFWCVFTLAQNSTGHQMACKTVRNVHAYKSRNHARIDIMRNFTVIQHSMAQGFSKKS